MAYQVLARKWRPARLADVVGQEHVVRAISGALRSGRIPHAFLFCGPRGVGKTTVARLLAKALNCEKGPTPEPCGKCGPCLEIPQGSAVDVLEIDGASHTGVDDVRQIIEAVQYAPARTRMKIYIIDEVHMLSISAFNALLKTLEEPPAHVVFVFATTDPQKIPATIVGRCQRFDFWRLPHALILEKLRRIVDAEHIAVDENALSALAECADGSLRDAEILLDQVLNAAGEDAKGKASTLRADDILSFLGRPRPKRVGELLNGLVARDGRDVLEKAGALYHEGFDLMAVSRMLLAEAHVRLLCVIGGDHARRIVQRTDAEWDELKGRAALTNEADLVQISEILIQMCQALHQFSDPFVVFTTFLSKIVLLPKLMDVQSILDRLAGAGGASARLSGSSVSKRPGAAVSVTEAAAAEAAPKPEGVSRGAGVDGSAFAEFVLRKSRMLGTFLKQGRIEVEEGRVVVRPPSGNVVASSMIQQQKGELSKLAGEFFGGAMEVLVESGQAAGAATAPPPAAPNEDWEGHPMYKEFVRVFQPETK